MATGANSYATIKEAEKGPSEGSPVDRAWQEVTPNELAAWIGIVGYMGAYDSPATRDYWKFEQIKRYFHVAPHDAPLNDSTAGKQL